MTDEPAAAKGKIIKDPELVAMAEVVELLDVLPLPCALRVLDWASRRYQSAAGPAKCENVTTEPSPFREIMLDRH